MHERVLVNDHQNMDVNVQVYFERTAEDRSVYLGTYYPGGVPSDVEVSTRCEGSQPGEFIPIHGIRSLMKGISTCLVDAQRSIYCGIPPAERGLGLDGSDGSSFVFGLVEPRSN